MSVLFILCADCYPFVLNVLPFTFIQCPLFVISDGFCLGASKVISHLHFHFWGGFFLFVFVVVSFSFSFSFFVFGGVLQMNIIGVVAWNGSFLWIFGKWCMHAIYHFVLPCSWNTHTQTKTKKKKQQSDKRWPINHVPWTWHQRIKEVKIIIKYRWIKTAMLVTTIEHTYFK